MKSKLTITFLFFLFESVFLLGQAGSLNNNFGDNGVVITPLGESNDFINDIAILPDGKIIAAGYSFSDDTKMDFAMVKYNVDGSIDNSFGNQGKVTLDFGLKSDICRSVLVQSDGKIILAGEASNDPTHVYALARFEADGSIDNSFGTNGKVTTSIVDGWDSGASANPATRWENIVRWI